MVVYVVSLAQEGTTWSKLFRGVTSRQPARQTARFIWDQNYAPSLIVVLSARKIWKSIAAVLKSVIFYQQKKQKSYHRDRFFALFQWLCVRTSLKLHIRPRKRVVFLAKKFVTFRFCRPGHYSWFIKRICYSYQLNTVSLVVNTLVYDAIGPGFDSGWILLKKKSLEIWDFSRQIASLHTVPPWFFHNFTCFPRGEI